MLAALLALSACDGATRMEVPPAEDVDVRIALFNVRELSTAKIAEVDASGAGTNPQLRAAAEIIATVRPDILVLNEVDHDYEAFGSTLTTAARAFATAYLMTAAEPIEYLYAYAAPNNTGMLSGIDLNGDGLVATDDHQGSREHGDDSFGFGVYPGQYSIAVLSRYPIISGESRTFQNLLWRDQPGNHFPADFYSAEAQAALRLSSKSHQDIPVAVDGQRLHLFLSHPTPPVFDGDEDRNGRRNFDEIMLWRQYIDGVESLVDDTGRTGGYAAGMPFVVVGDLNAAEGDAAVYDGVTAIDQLLAHTAIQDPADWVVSEGAPDNPWATTEFGDRGRRIDYVLPSRGIEIRDGGVYWPAAAADPDDNARALLASDHRLVWLDLRLPAVAADGGEVAAER
jgi:endonuclease/exonuclease/phosphatase family metal-dependent hydrolase